MTRLRPGWDKKIMELIEELHTQVFHLPDNALNDIEKRRQQDNETLLGLLQEKLETNPGLRFQQALWVLGIADAEDRFYEEPWDTLERLP